MERPLTLAIMEQIVACSDELRLRRPRRVVEQRDADDVKRQMVLRPITRRGRELREAVRG